MRVYVMVTRDGERWCARLSALSDAEVSAPTLRSLDRIVRRMTGASREAPLEYEFRTGDAELDRLVFEARRARRAAVRAGRRARALVDRVLTVAESQELSLRDLAMLLDISPQRVHQIVTRTASSAGSVGCGAGVIDTCNRT